MSNEVDSNTYIQELKKRGFTRNYWGARSLKEYSPSSDSMIELIENTHLRQAFFTVKSVINFYSEDESSSDLMLLFGRGLQLNGANVLVTTPLQLLSSDEIYTQLLGQTIYIALLDFYNKSYSESPFSNKEQYKIESILTEHLDNGGGLFLETGVPLEKIGWYSSKLLNRLKRSGKDVKVEPGNRFTF